MLVVDLAAAERNLTIGSRSFTHGATHFARMGSGEGDFRFERLTIGVVLHDLPTHATRHGDGKRNRIPLKRGEGWVFPAGIEGWCAWTGDTAFLNVELEAGILTEAGLAGPGAIAPRVGALDPLTVQLALALHAAHGSTPQLYRDSLGAALAGHLAGALTPQARAEAPSDGLMEPRLARVVAAIEDRLAEDLTLEILAEIAAMSPFHFARRFKAATGRAPYRYLMERRIERAKVLLRSSQTPIADIAFQVGWENPSHFASAFRAQTGITAGAWRAG